MPKFRYVIPALLENGEKEVMDFAGGKGGKALEIGPDELQISAVPSCASLFCAPPRRWRVCKKAHFDFWDM